MKTTKENECLTRKCRPGADSHTTKPKEKKKVSKTTK